MAYSADDLISVLDLEPLEHNIYRGRNRDIGTRRIYGGQVLAQALVAAQRTVEPDRPIHSMHGYFILPGDLASPVVYFVDRLRDGGSFTTRRVTAIQHGNAIFNLSASFHRREDGLEHQIDMPDVPPPEDLRDELDIVREHADQLPHGLREVATQDRPLDFRPVGGDYALGRGPTEPRRMMWVKTTTPIDDDPMHHRAVLAYASDYGLLVTSMRPHGRSARDPDMMVASLDHSLWFHADFRVDEWLLYVVDSPVSGGGRGFARGTYFTRDGKLVASTAQEGLIRVRREAR
jgi:acyl-CoA thioesterase-2